MTILLAAEFAPGRFAKVLVFRARQNGSGPLAAKWHGSLESMVVRGAARHFAADAAARHIDYDFNGRKFRATKA